MHTTPLRSTHGTTAVARAPSALTPILALVALVLTIGPARADVQTLDGTSAPIVRVNVRAGDVTVRTWDRQSVQVDADPSLEVVRRTIGGAFVPTSIPIPGVQQQSDEGQVSLAAESFVVGPIAPGPHETIVVRDPLLGGGGAAGFNAPTPVTITVPSDSALVYARTGNGTLDVHDYRGGTLIAVVGRGRMQLDNVGGTVFAQTNRAPMIVTNSSFDRLRARSLVGNMTYEHCDVRQIEATTVNGSIVYDGGTFQPGLAHFESTRGDVAVGANGPVELGGHAAGAGRVYTNFVRPARVDGHDGEGSVSIDGGGPVVTATSSGGNVYFYDGSLRSRPQLPSQWQPAMATLQRPATPVRREGIGATSNVPAIFQQRFPQQRFAPATYNRAPVRATPKPRRALFRRFTN